MYELHIANKNYSSWSLRPWILMRELQIEFAEQLVPFRVKTYALPLNEVAAAYARRLLDLPAMQEWYRAGLLETWRDEPHEVEIAACGTVLQDLRACR